MASGGNWGWAAWRFSAIGGSENHTEPVFSVRKRGAIRFDALTGNKDRSGSSKASWTAAFDEGGLVLTGFLNPLSFCRGYRAVLLEDDADKLSLAYSKWAKVGAARWKRRSVGETHESIDARGFVVSVLGAAAATVLPARQAGRTGRGSIKITDLKCAIIGSNPVIRIVTDHDRYGN